MKQKKTLPSAPEWTKVPVWVDSNSDVHVDSTPIMKQIDAAHNDGNCGLQMMNREETSGWNGSTYTCQEQLFRFCMEALVQHSKQQPVFQN